MELSYDIISQFAKVINEDKGRNQGIETTVYGVVVSDGNGNKYVKLDGSDQLTPLSDNERPSADSTTANANVGDRVTVSIKNHTATVTGNVSSPSVRTDDFNDLSSGVDQISKFNTVLADRVQTNEGYIKKLQSDKAEIGDLTAATAKITELEAKKANVEDLNAAKAEIDDLKTKKLDAEVANIKYATVENLKATNANIDELTGKHATFEKVVTDDLKAVKGNIKTLDTEKLNAKDADIKYAQIDFANIGKAAIEHFYATSGIIKDLVIGDTTVSGKLVGVTIIGDLIEGGTVKADKLVIQGTDGLYYKLNTDGMKTTAEQTEYNSLNGSIITAKSITAEKVNIHDLVAFGATIAGFNINETAIYSGVKDHPDTVVRGIYLDKDGQVSFGDATSYLKYYKDSNGLWRLEIAADNVRFSSSKKTLAEEIDDIKTDIEKTIVSVDVEYYLSTSATSTVGGSWSTLPPPWVNSKYMWSRTVTTYNTGNVEYSPNQNGVCIAGATGSTGNAGKGVVSIVEEYYKSTSSSSLAGGSWSEVYPGWENDTYIWTRSIITYTDNTTTTTEAICVTGSKGEKGDTGARGLQGIQGPKGEQGIAGTNGKTSYFHIKYSSVASPTAASQMSETPNTYIGTYVDYTATDSDDPKKYTWYRFQGLQGVKGDKGIPGTNGTNGKTSYLHIKYSNDGGKTFTANNGETTGDYIGQCTDFNATDPTSVSAYTWSKIKGEKGDTGARGLQGIQGPKGEQGIAGTNGKTSYFHIKYSSVASPTAASQMSETPNTYIGTYVDYTATDSDDPKKYTWYRFQGLQGVKGDKGIPGTNGTNGKTSYLHIKYSNDGGKTFTANNGETTGDYIGQCTDFNATDPTSVSAYTWSKIKGEKGDTGAKGDKGATGAAGKGVKSTEIAYQASTSGTTIPTGTWSASIPTVSAGSFLWTRTVITYTDNSKSTSYSIGKMGNTGATGAKGDKGATGPTGPTGAAGKGVKSTAITYQAGSSGTSAPTGTWSASVPATSASKPFLWTKTVITYTDNGTSTIYSVGSTPDSIQVGGRNLIRNSKGDTKAGFFSNFTKGSDGYYEVTLSSKGNYPSVDLGGGFVVSGREYPVGEKYIWSYDIMYTSWNFPAGTSVRELWMGQRYSSIPSGQTGTGAWTGITQHTLPKVGSDGCVLNSWHHVTRLVTIPTRASSNVSLQTAIQFNNPSTSVEASITFRLKNIKLEKGNKATDWTPAPEDIDNRFDAAETRITQAETSIETTNNQIALKASTETVTEIGNRANQLDKALSDALVTINKNRDAIATLTARDFKVQFTTLTNQLTQLNGDLTSYKKEVGNWMRFDADGNLVLGATREEGQDAYELKLTKSRISFMLNDVEVAYISNNELYITNSTVVQNLKIGRFVWEVRGNGNLGLVWR
jgi:hypothetical protein